MGCTWRRLRTLCRSRTSQREHGRSRCRASVVAEPFEEAFIGRELGKGGDKRRLPPRKTWLIGTERAHEGTAGVACPVASRRRRAPAPPDPEVELPARVDRRGSWCAGAGEITLCTMLALVSQEPYVTPRVASRPSFAPSFKRCLAPSFSRIFAPKSRPSSHCRWPSRLSLLPTSSLVSRTRFAVSPSFTPPY